MGCAHYRHQSRGPARGRKCGPEARTNDQAHLILLWCYVFQHFHADTGPGVDFLMKSLQTSALAALRRMCVVEMIASETFGDVLCAQVRKSCFSPIRAPISSILGFASVNSHHIGSGFQLFACCSGASLARISAKSIAPVFHWLLFR